MLRRCFSVVKALPVPSGIRVKLILPSVKDCWFTFTDADTFSKVNAAIQAEDPLVTSVSSDHAADETLSSILATQGKVSLRINDQEVTITHIEKEGNAQSRNSLQKALELVVASNPRSHEQLDTAVSNAINSLGEEIISKIERINAQVTLIQTQIDTLEASKLRLERRIDRRITLYGLLGVTFMTTQWGFFFYTIYGVDWLGWDLMEPITFSVGQLSFLTGVWYLMKRKTPNTFTQMSERYRAKKLQKLARKYNLDLSLYARLEAQKAELLAQRLKLSSRFRRGGPLPD